MNILFVHQNFPGQYLHLAPALAAEQGNRVAALTMRAGPQLPGVRTVRYRPLRAPSPDIHPWLAEQEVKVIRGEAAARAALKLRAQGFSPDVICAHPGWGEALFLKDVWPDARMLCYCEFYYRSKGSDIGFDPEFGSPVGEELSCRLRLKNAHILLSLVAADRGVSPTLWQRDQFPAELRDNIRVIFDGVDTAAACPDQGAKVRLQREDVTLGPADEVITFAARNLEPYRGFHVFMRALPEILRRRPRARALIAGGDGPGYGRRPRPGVTFRKALLAEVGRNLDMQRVHFVGRLPRPQFLDMLRISSVHVYLTYPFVLSWSLLEAMSCGCLVVGSGTPPVQEIVRHGENGLLVDFFQPEALADQICKVLERPGDFQELRRRARRAVIQHYDLKTVCLPLQKELIANLARG